MIGRVAIAVLLAALLGACSTPRDGARPPPADHHGSRQAVDWAGVYEGVLPCADCPGIRTRLSLLPGNRFELSTQYLERPLPPISSAGRFSWNADGNLITLEGAGAPQQWRVGEGRLLQVDRDGSMPDWNTPYRVLTKLAPQADDGLAPALTAHRWTLQAVGRNGDHAEGATVPGHPIVLRLEDTRLSVQGACNLMNGSWRLSEHAQIIIGRLASTMQACAPAQMHADALLSAALAQPLDVQLQTGTPPTLRLTGPDGNSLGFVGEPTPTSLYGAPERIFLEVAAQRVACTPATASADPLPAGARAALRRQRAGDGAAGAVAAVLR